MCNPILEETRAWVKRYFEHKSMPSSQTLPPSVEYKREKVYKRTGGKCWYCGVKLSLERGKKNRMTLDHVIPKSKGGTSDLDNLVPACRWCNTGKADSPLEVFRQRAGVGVFYGENLG